MAGRAIHRRSLHSISGSSTTIPIPFPPPSPAHSWKTPQISLPSQYVKKARHNWAIYFTGMYCLILLHNVLPHNHAADHLATSHQTETHLPHAHQYSHQHTEAHLHHQPKTAARDIFGILQDILGGIAHQDCGDSFAQLVISESGTTVLNAANKLPQTTQLTQNPNLPSPAGIPHPEYEAPPPRWYTSHIPDQTPQRGPPTFS